MKPTVTGDVDKWLTGSSVFEARGNINDDDRVKKLDIFSADFTEKADETPAENVAAEMGDDSDAMADTDDAGGGDDGDGFGASANYIDDDGDIVLVSLSNRSSEFYKDESLIGSGVNRYDVPPVDTLGTDNRLLVDKQSKFLSERHKRDDLTPSQWRDLFDTSTVSEKKSSKLSNLPLSELTRSVDTIEDILALSKAAKAPSLPDPKEISGKIRDLIGVAFTEMPSSEKEKLVNSVIETSSMMNDLKTVTVNGVVGTVNGDASSVVKMLKKALSSKGIAIETSDKAVELAVLGHALKKVIEGGVDVAIGELLKAIDDPKSGRDIIIEGIMVAAEKSNINACRMLLDFVGIGAIRLVDKTIIRTLFSNYVLNHAIPMNVSANELINLVSDIDPKWLTVDGKLSLDYLSYQSEDLMKLLSTDPRVGVSSLIAYGLENLSLQEHSDLLYASKR